MHIEIGSQLDGLAATQHDLLGRLIECLLHSHLNKHHCLCLMPRQIAFIQKNIVMGAQSRRILEAVLSKVQEYRASFTLASYKVRILLENSPIDFVVNGNLIYASPEWMIKSLSERPFLFVENEVNDGSFYDYIVKGLFLNSGGIPPIYIRAYNGGGSMLGEVLKQASMNNIKGLSICDRDTSKAVPPFVQHKTGDKAYKVVVDDGLLESGKLGVSRKNPLYAFHVTAGWSIENYIGPHQAMVYFEANQSHMLALSKLTPAFPKFPILSEDEMTCWQLIDFRHSTQSTYDLQTRFRELSKKSLSENLASLLAQVVLPGTILRWLYENGRSGRYQRLLNTAFAEDLKSRVYRNSVEDLAFLAHSMLAADSRMSFS